MKQILKKLGEKIAGKYDSYKAYDSIVFDDDFSATEKATAFKSKTRGQEINSLLEAAIARGNAFVDALPDNNPTQN
ncbi:MAG: hypothetical protein M9888_04845 [Chitinophagales bacterium]|nr:hypothetical protein [Chitinophagales bacterium]